MVKKALIVDDLPFDAELTRRVLESCKPAHDIVIVSDGEEALRELEKAHDFDVVLLDLKLPKIDGFEVLKELSSKPFLSEIPVVVLSNSRNEADRMRSQMLGGERIRGESARLCGLPDHPHAHPGAPWPVLHARQCAW